MVYVFRAGVLAQTGRANLKQQPLEMLNYKQLSSRLSWTRCRIAGCGEGNAKRRLERPPRTFIALCAHEPVSIVPIISNNLRVRFTGSDAELVLQ
jgi:hypothetical protein